MARNLQTIIEDIEKKDPAEEGRIITPDYHNLLREAVIELSKQTGTGTGRTDTSVTYAPVFLPITDGGARSPEWILSLGVSSRPLNVNSAKGWLPLQLPDDATIKSMTVTGQRSGTVLSCQVRLMRQTIADATTVPMIVVNLKNVTGQPFKATGEVAGASLPIIQDFRTVNNDKYQYLVLAELTLASPTSDAVVDLYAIQIAFATTNS
ncbi:MAG TPA: hypothetical protein VK892_09350 [Pyrinomonadaceae bacterium]|nr:hypothetical protein [Pyrinomonadaceae bacterium]